MSSEKIPCIVQFFNTMKTFKSLAIAVSSLCVMPTVAHAKNTSNDVGMAMMRLNSSALSDEIKYGTASVGNYKTQGGSVWHTLRSDFRMAEVNASLVRSHEYKFATNSAYFNRTLNRSRPYMYHIVQEVKKRGMPAEIALLPFIESAYVTKASSHVGASGLWQFMPATGRHYGLEQTPLYDGRHDVYAATNAALNYLQYLHGLFNDWSLALAAYNWGEGNVTRAVRRAQAMGIAPTYENLRMPAETRNYVPKLLAVRNLVRNPQAFGLNLPEISNSPYFKAVTVNEPVDIMAAAHLANISESEFLALNPAFKTPVFIPKSGRKMLLPVSAANTFESNYKNNNSKSLLSWDVFTPSYAMSLSEIAERTGTSVSELRRLNGLNGQRVSAGRSILVAKNGKNTQALTMNFVSVDKDNTPDTFVEQKQPIIAGFNAPVAQATTPAKQPTVSPQVLMAQQNFIVNQAAPTDFVASNKTKPSITWQPEPIAAPIEKVEVGNKVAVKAAEKVEKVEKVVEVAAAPVVETPKVAPAVAAASQEKSAAQPSPFASVELSVEEMAKLDAEIKGVTQNETAKSPTLAATTASAPVIDLALTENVNNVNDPLLALAEEKARALKEARAAAAAAKAKAKREAAEREKANRLAEAKAKREAEREKAAAAAKLAETKRKEAAEALRAEKLKQAQELASLRRAREAGEPISKAIREQKQLVGATTHRVREGDTLFNIAQRYNLNVTDLVNANNLRGNSIKIGQILKVSGMSKSGATSNNQSDKKSPLTKVSARTSSVMGLSRGVLVGNDKSLPKRANGQQQKVERTRLVSS